MIHGTGPRYCPSIEDKVIRFADKTRHQLFRRADGTRHRGNISFRAFHQACQTTSNIKCSPRSAGFENAQIMRFAYAIEYDCVNPLELRHTLEFKNIAGLYGAGAVQRFVGL